MAVIVNQGPLRDRLGSWGALIGAACTAIGRRALHGPLAPGWSLDFEIGNLFWRTQFRRAMAMADFSRGRTYFDSLQTRTDEIYDVVRESAPPGAPKGDWIIPAAPRSAATVLYLHGGGYAFHAAITRRFADMLAALLGARLFAPDYRLTPEHPHPAQQEDALAAYRYLLSQGIDPQQLVVIGDSAGGHLTLMTLAALRAAGLPQPALAVGLCPWTDIGARGASLTANDRYDLVQGWMAVRFGEWLVGSTGLSREALSPMGQDFTGLAPLYLQGRGREVLIDMIRDFARTVAGQGRQVMLDVWPQMTHEFQAHGLTRPESAEAISRIASAVACHVGDDPHRKPFGPYGRTEICSDGRTDGAHSV